MNRQYLLNKIGNASPPEKMVIEDQDAYDIIKRMILKHKSCAGDYDRIASDFEASDIYQVCEKIWNFCKKNIAYDEESITRQEVSAPQTILRKGHCDCKGYALFIGGILDALNRQGWNIKWKYRFASDDLFNEIPGHVFIVVNDGSNEIWVDPVLSQFNQDHFYPYYIDRKITVPVAVGRCGCASDGSAVGSTYTTGVMISKVSPALAAIPVVGWIGAAGGEIIGAFLQIFGSKYNTSTGVRWLTAKFEYYVLGNAGATSDNHVNENDTANAQKWFTTVLGVPIYDQYRYHALRGTSPTTGRSLNISREQRALNYLASAPDAVKLGVNFNDAYAATYPADKFGENNIDGSFPPGSWKGFTAAPALIETNQAAQPTVYVDQYGKLTTPAGQPYQATGEHNNLILLAAGAAILFIILK